jgi:CBS domain-containing protein
MGAQGRGQRVAGLMQRPAGSGASRRRRRKEGEADAGGSGASRSGRRAVRGRIRDVIDRGCNVSERPPAIRGGQVGVPGWQKFWAILSSMRRRGLVEDHGPSFTDIDMKGHARNIMTAHAIAIAPETSLETIARTLVDNGIGGTTVVDEDENVIGFVSETDLITALLAGPVANQTASSIMTHPPIVVDEFAPSDEVMQILRESQIHHLPVVRNGKLVGIITPHDVIRYFVEKQLPPEPEVG